MKRFLILALLALATTASADRASDRAAIQSILGATKAQMDSLEIWYPGTDVVVDFTDRMKFHFKKYRKDWEAKTATIAHHRSASQSWTRC